MLAAQLDKTSGRKIKTGKYGGAKLTDILGYTLFLNGQFAFFIEHFNQDFDRNRVASLFSLVRDLSFRETLAGFVPHRPKAGFGTRLRYIVTPQRIDRKTFRWSLTDKRHPYFHHGP